MSTTLFITYPLKYKRLSISFFLVIILTFLNGIVIAQDYEIHKKIKDAVIYDYDPATKIGDDIFGTIMADFSKPVNGELRCSHGSPVCMEYANGTIVAFYANTSSHNVDGWSEYALSNDKGKTWDKYHPFPYSYEAYMKDSLHQVWIEEGLVTEKGTGILFLTQFERDKRTGNSIMRSYDNGVTWSDPEPMADKLIGYPAAVAVVGNVNYVLFDEEMDGEPGYHQLYISTDDGKTWSKRSTLPLQKDAWYGALCVMEDGSLLAGAYVTNDEKHLYYTISNDDGYTWEKQEKAYVDKKIRDPELAYLDGKYYLHGRSGHKGRGKHRFVLYQSENGIHWKKGVIISGDERKVDGYSHNCIINKYNNTTPKEIMVLYSITYNPPRTSEYVFFIKPDQKSDK